MDLLLILVTGSKGYITSPPPKQGNLYVLCSRTKKHVANNGGTRNDSNNDMGSASRTRRVAALDPWVVFRGLPPIRKKTRTQITAIAMFLAKLEYFTNLDFPEIKDFPYLP